MKMSTKPTLTPEAENKIAEQYSRWRIDKAEAHAKMRLSKSIDITDALAAIEVMRFVIEAEDTNLHALQAKDELNSDSDIMAMNFKIFQTKLPNFMSLKSQVTIEEIEDESRSWFNEKPTRRDIQVMLQKLHARNQIMIDNDIIYSV
ncbi:unnamed protein product [Bathycoccus prasinos]